MASISVLDSICNKLVIFKRLSVTCCNRVDNSTNVELEHWIDDFYNFDCDSNYILKSHGLISSFFDEQDIGKIVTDIDGVCMHINKNIPTMLGTAKKNILYHHMCSVNVNTYDYSDVNAKWQTALKNQSRLIYKERRTHGSGDTVYLIVEVHPYYSNNGNGFMGMHGVLVRVTKQVWRQFNVEESKDNSSHDNRIITFQVE